MRWVSLPEELTASSLLEISIGVRPIRDHLAQILSQLAAGSLDGSLRAASRAVEAATDLHHRYAAALALVLRADLLRRRLRWEDSLDDVRHALRWLELDVSPVARYNEAIAVYLEGLVHYTLRADDKAGATFAYVQSSLQESARHWAFEHSTARVSDCRNVIRWLSQLTACQEAATSASVVLVMPVYELANRTLIHTDAFALSPFQLMIPREVVRAYCPPGVQPLQLDTLAFPSLRPDIQYAAIRMAEPLQAVGTIRFSEIKRGDLLILEVTGVAPESDDLVLTADQPFERSGDGRVVFHPVPKGRDPGGKGAANGLMGIPRMVIKDVEAQ